jgi:hypothetical protein
MRKQSTSGIKRAYIVILDTTKGKQLPRKAHGNGQTRVMPVPQ